MVREIIKIFLLLSIFQLAVQQSCLGNICIANSQDDLEKALSKEGVTAIAIAKDLNLTSTVTISNDAIQIGLFNSITFAHDSDGFQINSGATVQMITTAPALEMMPDLKNYSDFIKFSNEVTISGSTNAFAGKGSLLMNCTGNKVTIKNNKKSFYFENEEEEFGTLTIIGNIDFTSAENVILTQETTVIIMADGIIQSSTPIINEGNMMIAGGLKDKLIIKSTDTESIAVESSNSIVVLIGVPEGYEETEIPEVEVFPHGDLEIKGAFNLNGVIFAISCYEKKITIENENGDGIISSNSMVTLGMGKITIKGNPEAINLKSAGEEGGYIYIAYVSDIEFSSDSATTLYKFSVQPEDETGVAILPNVTTVEESPCFVPNSMSFIIKDSQIRGSPTINKENFACIDFTQKTGSKKGSFDNVVIFDTQEKSGFVTVGSKGNFTDEKIKYIAINSGASFGDSSKTSGAVIAVVVIVCIIVVAVVAFIIFRVIKKKSAVDTLEGLTASFKA